MHAYLAATQYRRTNIINEGRQVKSNKYGFIHDEL